MLGTDFFDGGGPKNPDSPITRIDFVSSSRKRESSSHEGIGGTGGRGLGPGGRENGFSST